MLLETLYQNCDFYKSYKFIEFYKIIEIIVLIMKINNQENMSLVY